MQWDKWDPNIHHNRMINTAPESVENLDPNLDKQVDTEDERERIRHREREWEESWSYEPRDTKYRGWSPQKTNKENWDSEEDECPTGKHNSLPKSINKM